MYSAKPRWLQNKVVKGVLLDITGVLYNSGQHGGLVVEGSVKAVKRLKEAGLAVKFCTNETQCTMEILTNKLNKFGFNVRLNEIYSPAPLAKSYVLTNNLRPYLLVHSEALEEYSDIDQSDPNCVIVGDAANEFSYKNMNKAFAVLTNTNTPFLLALGYGRYYLNNGELVLDNGPFVKALEFACENVTTVVLGKPAMSYFKGALDQLGFQPENVIMIGDDIVGDIGGAQNCGITAVQVRTGKYRKQDESHHTIKADGHVTNLAEAVDLILQFNNIY